MRYSLELASSSNSKSNSKSIPPGGFIINLYLELELELELE